MKLSDCNLEEIFVPRTRFHLIASDDWDGIEVSARFFCEGIKNGEQCVYFGDSIDVGRLFKECDSLGIDLASCLSSGQLSLKPCSKLCSDKSVEEIAAALSEAVNNALKSGYSGFRFVADGTCICSGTSLQDIWAIQGAMDEVFSEYPASAIFCYNLDSFDTIDFFNTLDDVTGVIYKSCGTVYLYNKKDDESKRNLKRHEEDTIRQLLLERQNLRNENTIYKFLIDLASQVVYKDNPQEILAIVLKKYIKACAADMGAIKLYKNTDLRINEDILVTEGVPWDFIEEFRSKSDGNMNKRVKELLSSPKCLCYDYDSDMPEYLKIAHLKYGIKSCILVPIIFEEKLSGILILASSKKKHSFSAHTSFLMESCKNSISVLASQAKLLNMYQQLSQMKKMDALGVLASGIAHEFNNLLTPVLGFSQILKSRIEDPHLKFYISMIENSAKDGAMIVKRIQDFTKKEDNKTRVKVDINEIISDAINMTQPKWKNEAEALGKKIEVNKKLSSSGYVLANSTELREVVTNMIINAYDSIDCIGTIVLESWNEGEFICFSVKDDGIGMSRETLDNIFTPFFTTKSNRGTGLGLPIAYNIIRNHGGTITAESTQGKGATFTVKLPAYGFENMEEASRGEEGKLRGRVLVVDDEEIVAYTARLMLEEFGLQVDVASSGKDGVRMYEENGYDLVYCDFAMPNMNGLEVVKKIREINPRAHIIMTTGWVGGISEKDSESLDGFLYKPYTMRELYDITKKVLGGGEQ